MSTEDADDKLSRLADREKLPDALADRDGGELFRGDLQEAQELAERDPRFRELARGLEADSLGERLGAISAFFKEIDADELRQMELPPHLSQLRTIFLMSD